jgi:hypothetical protein
MLTLFGHQPKSHYQPEATVRCELIHKHGFGCRFLSALMQHIGEFFDVRCRLVACSSWHGVAMEWMIEG